MARLSLPRGMQAIALRRSAVQVDGAVLAELREVDDSGRAGRHCDRGQVGGDLDGAIGYVRRDIGYRQRSMRSIGCAPIERTRLVWQVQHEMDVPRCHARRLIPIAAPSRLADERIAAD